MNPKVVDFFAGIGGIRLGFEQAEFDCVFSNEIDPYCCITYKENFGDDPKGDITKLNPSDIKPEFDVFVGGFPCQAFSIAGRKLGFEDTRGTLFFDIVKILKDKNPKAFLLENVKNLKSHDKGKTFATILNVLENDLKYNVAVKILNAKDFGVAQNRERVYIVGFRKDVFSEKFEFPESTNDKKVLKDILEKNVPIKYFISKKRLEGMKRHKARHAAKGNGFGYGVLDPNDVSKTIVIGGMGRERNLVVDTDSYLKHKKDPAFKDKNTEAIRYLTPREYARLQGFPEEYKIPVSNAQAYKQFANAVAVPVIKEIAKKMKKILEKSSS